MFMRQSRGMLRTWAGVLSGLIVATGAYAGALTVVSTSPQQRTLIAPIATPVSVTFDQAVMTSSVNFQTFYVFGRWSGSATGIYSFSNGNKTVTLTPTRPFSPGEQVMVALSNGLLASDGTPLRSQGYSYVFWTRTRPASMVFSASVPFSNRAGGPGGPQTRIYGASGTDFNEDGFLDLATVNEVSQDVRVFLNSADGLGNYDMPFLTPEPIGNEASPNEPADFNRDGHADLCAAAASSSDVWILLGAGDGTFSSAQSVSVGASPHGIAVLDANGDGAMDIATSNTGSGNVSLMLNNGSGVFGAPSSIPTSGNGEYALGAADMNNDGILDLVVGAINGQTVVVLRGNGNGTFTEISSQNAGGSIWMLTTGDVNGDGNMDVASANSFSNNGSILLGNGAGALGAPSTISTLPHVAATDLGDLDGDGDMDWELSSFGGGGWRVYRNNGAGVFTFDQEFTALNNPSCAVLLDIDNDRDLDIALTDEIADVITLERNSGTDKLGDFDNDGDVDNADFTAFSGCYTANGVDAGLACGHGDFNGDGDCDCTDFGLFQDNWTAGGTPPNLPQCAGIPAASTWTMIIMGLMVVGVGIEISKRRLQAA